MTSTRPPTQCQRPRGPLGRVVLWLMNLRHSGVTDWGLRRVTIKENDTILDVGCGGGRTVSKLAAAASKGKTYGIDYSEESVTWARKTNRQFIDGAGFVDIQVHEERSKAQNSVMIIERRLSTRSFRRSAG